MEARSSACPNAPSNCSSVDQTGLAFQLGPANDVDGARLLVDDLSPLPLAHDAARAFARHVGQGSQVFLAQPVADDQSVLRVGLAQVLGEQEAGRARPAR